jgi:hypothetical protein
MASRELIELGRLTALDDFVWSMRGAPILAYDTAGGLHIVYAGERVGPSTKSARGEYARTHWGREGRGSERWGFVAVGPFKNLGPSRTIQYTTKKGRDRELVDYVHTWGEGSLRRCVPPVVLVHRCGPRCGPRCAARGSLALSGGSYTVSERGIVG